MKKSLIALAALSTIAGSVAAQSSVTIYGRINPGVATQELTSGGGKVTKTTGYQANGWTNPRLGLNIAEDLGGGLTAIGTWEANIATEGAAVGTVRQAFAGIRGKNFGTVTIGNQYTTEFGQGITVAGTVNSYGFGGSGLSVSTSGKQTNTAVHRLGEITQGNSIRWVAPAVSGITFAADLGKSTSEATGTTGGANTTDTTSDFLGLSANYKAGKLNATLAYSEIKEKSLLQATPSVTVVSATSQCVDTGMVYGAFSGDDQSGGTCTLTAPLRDRKQKNLTASATYDLTAAAKVYAYYADREMTGTTVLDYKTYNLGAQYTIGKVTPFAQMSDGKLKSSTGATTADLSSYQVGATYAFSKRTTGYAYVAEYKNKVATGTDAKKAEVTAFGISHNF